MHLYNLYVMSLKLFSGKTLGLCRLGHTGLEGAHEHLHREDFTCYPESETVILYPVRKVR